MRLRMVYSKIVAINNVQILHSFMELVKLAGTLSFVSKQLWEQLKILKEMGIPDHLNCLLRSLYADQEATVGTGHGKLDWFQIGKGIRQSCILSPCSFNLYGEYIMRNTGLDEAQGRIKIAGRNINTSDMQMTPPLWHKVKKS